MSEEKHKALIDDPRILRVPVFKPLVLDPSLLRPLPQSLWGLACEWCDKRQSRWELFLPEAPPDARKGLAICSLCWLYESKWGQEKRADLDLFIGAVENEISQPFSKRPTGELLECRDADRILAAIGVTSRIATYRGALQKMRQGDET